jgi:hypothetical protein
VSAADLEQPFEERSAIGRPERCRPDAHQRQHVLAADAQLALIPSPLDRIEPVAWPVELDGDLGQSIAVGDDEVEVGSQRIGNVGAAELPVVHWQHVGETWLAVDSATAPPVHGNELSVDRSLVVVHEDRDTIHGSKDTEGRRVATAATRPWGSSEIAVRGVQNRLRGDAAERRAS